MGPFGLVVDNDEDSHSPLLFLLADALPDYLLDFRIHDLVVAGRLHSLRKGKYKLNTEDMLYRKTLIKEEKQKHKGKINRTVV